MKTNYEFIPHTADIGIRVRGKTFSALFRNSAYALVEIMTDRQKVQPTLRKTVKINAPGIEELLNYWLSFILKEFTVNQRLIKTVHIKSIDTQSLTAIINGGKFTPKRHPIRREIKAVTFHNLSVKPIAGGWQAEVIFDV